MAATNFTPISLYYSTTAAAVPTSVNLVNGELALNIVDMKLYAKNSSGVVTLLASSGGASGTVSSVALTFNDGLITVSGSPITSSGTLALGVTGISGGIPYFSSGSTWTTSATLAANALVIGGGAGAAPATTTTGTGVVTALGVNTGSAGAFVVNGGALGTPSSGTLSSCTVDGTNAVGYRNIPPVGAKTSAYTIAVGDVGKYVEVQSGGSIVVPASVFANGDVVSFYNNSTGNITFTTSAVNAYLAGTNTLRTSVTLATRGVANIMYIDASTVVITGNVS